MVRGAAPHDGIAGREQSENRFRLVTARNECRQRCLLGVWAFESYCDKSP